MKKPKAHAKERDTLNKQIAAAMTLAQKWHIALTSGKSPTRMENLVANAAGCAEPTLPEVVATCKRLYGVDLVQDNARIESGIKAEFVDLLFPSLVAGDTAPFETLIRAIRARRAAIRTMPSTVEEIKRRQKVEPSKKAKGRYQRLALLHVWLAMKKQGTPLNMENLKAGIAKHDYHPSGWQLFADDAAIYKVLAKLGLKLTG